MDVVNFLLLLCGTEMQESRLICSPCDVPSSGPQSHAWHVGERKDLKRLQPAGPANCRAPAGQQDDSYQDQPRIHRNGFIQQPRASLRAGPLAKNVAAASGRR